MERDHINRAVENEARESPTELASSGDEFTGAGTARSIPRARARELLDRILVERAEVFRKLAK